MWGTYPYYYSVDQAGNLVTPTVGFPTRATRDVIRTGGLWNFDMSIFKNIPIRERYSIRLRLEGYNVFNHPNFDDKNFGVNINGPWQWTYGTPAGAGSSSPDHHYLEGNQLEYPCRHLQSQRWAGRFSCHTTRSQVYLLARAFPKSMRNLGGFHNFRT